MEVSFEVEALVDLDYYLLDYRSAASPSVEPSAVVAVVELGLELELELLVAAEVVVAVESGRVD